jgi:hypothetical protein
MAYLVIILYALPFQNYNAYKVDAASNRNEYQESSWRVKGSRRLGLTTAICGQIVWKMWEPQPLTILWTSRACYRDNFTFL